MKSLEFWLAIAVIGLVGAWMNYVVRCLHEILGYLKRHEDDESDEAKLEKIRQR
ncbi:MAG: hypothetical protein ACYDDI_03005 [Candidatus Acidiferrales bacterium]